MMVSAAPTDEPSGPWYRQVSRDQWRAFWATFLGWMLDGFDFTILTFVLIDIQETFTVDRTLAGALGTVTLFTRLIGGMAAGSAADRWGRRLPLAISILWFSLFAFLSGFSTSYAMLFGLRALFGIGMGGEWAAGMPLVLEHWPKHLRGLVSGLLQGGFAWGYIVSAATFQYVYPVFGETTGLGWRVMLWTGILPALLTLWIRVKVKESPVWLARQQRLADARAAGAPAAGDAGEEGELRFSVARIFRRDLIGTTLQTTVLMAGFMFSYYSITYWYATFLIETGRPTLGPVVALNIGGILGTAFWGRLSESRLGRRGTVVIAAGLGILAIPLYLYAEGVALFWIGALVMGACGHGAWGVVPSYLTERFPTAARSGGAGFVYHAGAAIGALTPTVLGTLQDRGMALNDTMAIGIGLSGVLIAVAIWSGPETRGRSF